MKIALFSKELRDEYIPVLIKLVEFLYHNNIDGLLYDEVYQELKKHSALCEKFKVFKRDIKKEHPDLFITIGGDGTFINSIAFVKNTEIPVAGVNCGRLGYLADIQVNEVEEAIKLFMNGEYRIEKRTLLELSGERGVFKNVPLALNEVTVQKRDTSSMISVETYIDGQLLTTYWADGLIVSTPTGSTAYSMSVGGPIVSPNLNGLIIIPIASHHLTVRPVLVPQDVKIEMKIEGRGNKFMVSADHKSYPIDLPAKLTVQKSDFEISVVKFNGHNFYSTLRNRLMWGVDPRNV